MKETCLTSIPGPRRTHRDTHRNRHQRRGFNPLEDLFDDDEADGEDLAAELGGNPISKGGGAGGATTT